MNSKLQKKIILILALILFLVLGVYFISNNITLKKVYSKSVKNEVLVAGKALSYNLERLLKFQSIDSLIGFEEISQNTVEAYDNISYCLIVNDSGDILSSAGEYSPLQPLNESELLALTIAIVKEREEIIDYKSEHGNFTDIIIPVKGISGKYEGAVILGIPQNIITKKIMLMLGSSALIAVILFIFCVFPISFLLSFWITKPIIKLNNATLDIISKGPEKFHTLNIKSNDELGMLANSFNVMGEQLHKTMVSKTYVDSIISTMIDSLIVIDSELKIQTVNESTCEMLGYNCDALILKPVDILFAEGEKNPFKGEDLKELLTYREVKNYETKYKTIGGKIITVLLSCSVVKDNTNALNYIVCTAKDITELKIAEEALKVQAEKLIHSNQHLQQFACIASHDLKEPLRKVIAFSNMLKENCASNLDEFSLDYISRIINATVRMQTLINDLLKYSKISSTPNTFELVNLEEIALEVINDLEIQIKGTRAKINLGQLPIVEADPTQMRQLFQNFISNSLKYTHKERTPVINIFSKNIIGKTFFPKYNNYCNEISEIYFQDNGIGIERKNFDKIFGVFQRLHCSNKYEGTGIGLAICEKIVERHTGEIHITSEVDIGTTFIVRLPKNSINKV